MDDYKHNPVQQTTHEHQTILNSLKTLHEEIKGMREDMTGMVSKVYEKMDKIKTALHEEQRRLDRVESTNKTLTRILWTFGSAVGLYLLNDILKLIGS